MIRLFNTYFPTRTILLTLTEAVLVTAGFVLAVVFTSGNMPPRKPTCFTRMAPEESALLCWFFWC